VLFTGTSTVDLYDGEMKRLEIPAKKGTAGHPFRARCRVMRLRQGWIPLVCASSPMHNKLLKRDPVHGKSRGKLATLAGSRTGNYQDHFFAKETEGTGTRFVKLRIKIEPDGENQARFPIRNERVVRLASQRVFRHFSCQRTTS
jgi:hypothetical protein